MKATEQLKEEHREIKSMLKILETICEIIKKEGYIPREYLERVVKFLKVFADKCHHGKEEEILFPAMEEAGIPKEGGPIAVMLAEHDTGRGYVKAMDEAIPRGDLGKFVENAEKYIQLLKQHIDKEDNVLYWMADIHLSENKQNELLEEFERMERERIGAGKHEELRKLMHELKGRILERRLKGIP